MHPHDTGPIYRETLMGRLPVEPWNTFSNAIFLLLVLIWAWRVVPDFRRHGFLAFMLPVLFLGFVGGTVFHATRSHEIWLLMDWVPIVVLCMAATGLFALRAGAPWWLVVPLLLLPFGLRYLMLDVLQWPATIVMNLGYAALGAVVLGPLVLHLHRNGWQNAGTVLTSAGCFALALVFRSLDHSPLLFALPMGTHWLWHLLGGCAVHFLVRYIYLDDLRQRAAA